MNIRKKKINKQQIIMMKIEFAVMLQGIKMLSQIPLLLIFSLTLNFRLKLAY